MQVPKIFEPRQISNLILSKCKENPSHTKVQFLQKENMWKCDFTSVLCTARIEYNKQWEDPMLR